MTTIQKQARGTNREITPQATEVLHSRQDNIDESSVADNLPSRYAKTPNKIALATDTRRAPTRTEPMPMEGTDSKSVLKTLPVLMLITTLTRPSSTIVQMRSPSETARCLGTQNSRISWAVFPCRTGTSRSCSASEGSTPITSRCGVGSSGMPQNWNDVCAPGSDRPTTVGEWTKPTSESGASGSIYTGLSTPEGQPLTSFCRLNAARQRPSAFSPRPWAERIIPRRESSTPTRTPLIRRPSCGSKPTVLWGRTAGVDRSSTWNNVLEQDHRAIKRRIRASQHFRSFWGAWRTIAGYEAIHMICKGQASGSVPAARAGLLHRFILGLFSAAAV
jgi:DDE domain